MFNMCTSLISFQLNLSHPWEISYSCGNRQVYLCITIKKPFRVATCVCVIGWGLCRFTMHVIPKKNARHARNVPPAGLPHTQQEHRYVNRMGGGGGGGGGGVF